MENDHGAALAGRQREHALKEESTMCRDHEDQQAGWTEGERPAADPGAESGTGRIRLLVVDDHPMVRAGIVATIQEVGDMQVVAQASTGEQAIRMYRAHLPDVVLMDLSMPGMDGWTAIDLIRREFPHARIVVLSVRDGDEEIRRAVALGAAGYLFKDAGREKVVGSIRAVHMGLRELPEPLQPDRGRTAAELTARELEVLQLIARGFTNKEIGQLLSITEGTVKTHVVNILGKMSVRDRTQAVTVALQRGVISLD
ncbi:MAG: response regulator transcription factor [Acidobacteriota bacterium]